MAKASKSPLIPLAKQAEADGQNQRSERILQKAITDTPKDPTAYAMLIRLYLRKLNATNLALPLLPQLLKLAPRSALAHELAAECYCRKRIFNDAKAHADRSVRLGPKSPDGLYVAATVHYEMKDYVAATKYMETCLAIRPHHLPSRLLYAKSLREAGDLQKSETICRAIFEEYPDSMTNYSIWYQTCKITADDPIYLHIRDTIYPVLRDKKLLACIEVLHILGKAENDIGNFDTAFQHVTDAKKLSGLNNDRQVNKNFINAVTHGISPADYFGAAGLESEIPVLIVGMPRTGSTLLQQILSSHPQIGGIGESRYLRDSRRKIGVRHGDGPAMVNAIHKISAEQALALAEEYTQKSQNEQPGVLRIVDKKLHNFENLGLFAKMFPKARIINALRDPMDTCVSCYLAPLKRFHSYTQDLTSLGQYYCEYRRLMEHWKKVLPNQIMDVSYEDVVADTEGKAREVIDFLGLEWDQACIDFQKNENRARTISTWQVRQPIYKSSVKRWARYEKHLDPLKAELAQFYPDGF
jgi:tetratricopeptide (TPR) repeat protein